MYQMRELLYQGRSVHRHLNLLNEGYSLYHFVFWMLHYEYCYFFDCIAFKMVGHIFWYQPNWVGITEIHMFETCFFG